MARDPEEVERGIQSLMERRMMKNVEDILISVIREQGYGQNRAHRHRHQV